MIASCPYCDNQFYVPVDLGGNIVKCSKCKKEVQAPEAPDMSNMALGSMNLESSVGTVIGSELGREREKTAGVAVGTKKSPPSTRQADKTAVSLSNAGNWPSTSIAPRKALKKSLKQRFNFYRGIARLAFVLSLAALLPALPDLARYLLDRSVWSVKDIVAFFLPWPTVGFLGVWAGYGICFCIARGFNRKIGGSRSRGFRRLTFVISLGPLVPAVVSAFQDYSQRPYLRIRQLLVGHFLYWPLAGFLGVWIVYLASLFVLRGFYDSEGTDRKKLEHTALIRNKKPAEKQASRSGSWRTT